MKKLKFLASLLLCVTILATCFSTLCLAEDTTDDEATAISALVSAWSGLKVTKTELFAIPKDDVYRFTTADSNLTDEEKTAFGEYYFYNTTANPGGYRAPDGTTNFADYSDRDSVTYTYYYKVIFGSAETKNFEVNIQRNDSTYFPEYLSAGNSLAQRTIDAVDKGVTNIKQIQIKNPHAHTVYMGCIYATHTGALALPENYESFTADDWAAAVSQLDFEAITVTDEFKAAVAEVQKYTIDYEAVEALKTAYGSLLSNEKTELFAIPQSDYRFVTADATDLTDEEKAAFGEYYYFTNAKGTGGYRAPDDTTNFADYSSKENVKYTFSYKMIFGESSTKNFQVNLNRSESGWGGPFPSSSTLTTYTIEESEWIKGIQIKNNNIHTIYMGCIYATYQEKLAMPENYEFFIAEDWLNAVYNTDFSDYIVTDDFKTALAALQATTEEGQKIIALKDAYSALKLTKTELFAIPYGEAYRKTTADATDLTDEEKAAFGEYYYFTNAQGTGGYRAPDDTTNFADYSSKENIKYTFSYKMIFGESSKRNFQVNLNRSESGWGGPFPSSSTLTTYTIEESEWIKGIQIKNPNIHTIYMGCMYATYDEAITMPENYELFSAEDWINTVYNLDLSACTLTDTFVSAFTALKVSADLASDGDVNADTAVDICDLVRLALVLQGEVADYNKSVCDVDSDVQIGTEDLSALRKILLK